MSALIAFPSPSVREQDLRAFQDVLPAAVKATVDELGTEALQSFFDGYKDSVDLQKTAA